MGKPLNHQEQGCNPISSNCVIWQGPDIECINLCTGDTVSDVVEKLAIELCRLDGILDIDNYNIDCFNLASGAGAPEDFPELIQFMIDRICNLEECTGCAPDCDGNSELDIPEELATPCCDADVEIAECFYYQNEYGDTVTTMTLSDYLHAIGNRLCDIEDSVENHGIDINGVTKRTAVLEGADPYEYTPDDITPVCVLPANPTDPFDVLVALETQFCELRTATGEPNDILNKTAVPTEVANGDLICSPGTKFKDTAAWNDEGTLADSVGNIWQAIVDLRCGVANALECCPDDCEDVVINMTAQYVYPDLRIWFTGSVPAHYSSCYPGGVEVTITDTAGGSYTLWIDFITVMTSGTYYSLNLTAVPGLDPNLDFTITASPCVKNNDTGSVCEKCLTYYLVNDSECPAVAFVSTNTTIQYLLTSTVGTHTYTVQLMSADGTVTYSTQTFTTTSIVVTPGTFIGLTAGTTYRVRVTVTTGTSTKVCPDWITTTNPLPCDPPTGVSSSVYTV